MVVGATLHTTAGGRVDLSAVGPVATVRRAPVGWLVITRPRPGTAGLWYVTATARPVPVLTDIDAVTVASDGQRVSWRAGGTLSVGTLSGGTFSSSTDVPAPPGAEPAGFVGVAVLLRRAEAQGGGYGLWWPAEPTPPTWSWNPDALGVYGQLPENRGLLGLVSAGQPARPCLAVLDVNRALAPLRTACGAPLGGDARGAISPDGRWLVADAEHPAGTPTAGPGSCLVVDLATVFDRPTGARPAGPALTGDPVWTDAGSLTYLGGPAELVRVAADRIAAGGEGVERFPVPNARAGDPVVLVADTR
ncbi:hypothetical protein GCM10027605_08100 [Micromonospora zhanjiangensis]